MGVPYTRIKRNDPRMRRLEHVLRYEGHELPDFILVERFPWAKSSILATTRKRLGIPAPDSDLLTHSEMKNAKTTFDVHDPGMFGRRSKYR